MEAKGKIVLVVEDEQPLLDAIMLKLEKAGFSPTGARSVQQAKNYTEDLPHVDAIWLDHYLIGKEDGLDFVAWCKERGNIKCNRVPIFVVSNTASSDKVSSYMFLGITKYFVKANNRLDEIISDIMKSLQESESPLT